MSEWPLCRESEVRKDSSQRLWIFENESEKKDIPGGVGVHGTLFMFGWVGKNKISLTARLDNITNNFQKK